MGRELKPIQRGKPIAATVGLTLREGITEDGLEVRYPRLAGGYNSLRQECIDCCGRIYKVKPPAVLSRQQTVHATPA
jgi:hypothetical protein